MHDANREVRVHSGLTSTWAGVSCAVRRARAVGSAPLFAAFALGLLACGPQAGGQSGTECNTGDPGFKTLVVGCECENAGSNSVVVGTLIAQDDESVRVQVTEVLATASDAGVTVVLGDELEGRPTPCAAGLTAEPGDEVIAIYAAHEAERGDQLIVLPAGEPLMIGEPEAPHLLAREEIDTLVDGVRCADWLAASAPDAGPGDSMIALVPVEDERIQCDAP